MSPLAGIRLPSTETVVHTLRRTMRNVYNYADESAHRYARGEKNPLTRGPDWRLHIQPNAGDAKVGTKNSCVHTLDGAQQNTHRNSDALDASLA